nr:MAG TPA: hypothetical protein [Caudoviricetes sp.]
MKFLVSKLFLNCRKSTSARSQSFSIKFYRSEIFQKFFRLIFLRKFFQGAILCKFIP